MTVRKARVTCPLDCPDACSLIASIDEESNTLLKIEGDPRHPITQGFACVKTYRYPERNHHPLRPLYPLRRVGKKGEGRFERVSWGTALDEIARRLRQVIEAHGPEAVLPYHYAGTMGLMQYEPQFGKAIHPIVPHCPTRRRQAGSRSINLRRP